MASAVVTIESIREFVGNVEKCAAQYLEQVHPNKAREAAGRMVMTIRQAAATNPDIYLCTPASVGRAIAMCVITDLAPGGALPLVWLIPRRNKYAGNQLELNWQISVRGLQAIAARSGFWVRSVPVFTGDHFELRQGLRPDIVHEPDDSVDQNWSNLRGVYVVAYEKGSSEPLPPEWVPKSTIQKLRNAGASTGNIWNSWPIEMARARAVGYALKRGIVPIVDDALREATESEGGILDTTPLSAETLPAAAVPAERPRGLRAALAEESHTVTIPVAEAELEPEEEADPPPRRVAKPRQAAKQAAPPKDDPEADAAKPADPWAAGAKYLADRAFSPGQIAAAQKKGEAALAAKKVPDLLAYAELYASEHDPDGMDGGDEGMPS